jgi:hypothetical protein
MFRRKVGSGGLQCAAIGSHFVTLPGSSGDAAPTFSDEPHVVALAYEAVRESAVHPGDSEPTSPIGGIREVGEVRKSNIVLVDQGRDAATDYGMKVPFDRL